MTKHSCCCHVTPRKTIRNSKVRRILDSTRWIVPTVALALVPKCPMCVAAYIALATGLSVSLSVATWIRAGLIAACIGIIAYLSIRVAFRSLGRRRFSAAARVET